jgi:high-affinity iron transporter
MVTAVVLLGKGLHALQTLGMLPLRPIPFLWIEPLGIFPDAYTLLAQLALALSPLPWFLFRRHPRASSESIDTRSGEFQAK